MCWYRNDSQEIAMPTALKVLPLLRVVNKYDQDRYMTAVVWLLRRSGVTVHGKPLWISPSIFIDAAFPGAVTIGDRSVISESVKLLTHDFSLDRVAEGRGELEDHLELYREAPVSIGTRAFIGMGSIVMPGVTIGNGAIVGAGSVVTRDVQSDDAVAGNPAKLVCTTDELWDKRREQYQVRKRRT
jgi:acetyltransferase-like isoleucine patch superfamily enzyme